MKKVAAVIPLYNHERYISEALQSLLAQTVPFAEIIVIDDGSTDRSVEVASGFKDPRIRILRQENAGAHAALNRGIAAAGCEYVALLNSDDVYPPERVGKCLAFLEEHEELDLVFTRLRLIDPESKKLDAATPRAKWFEAVWSLEKEELSLPAWLGIANFPGTTSNFFARRSYLLAHPFGDYRYAHDYYALIRCALAGRLGLLPEELLSYRVHPQNTISTKPELLIKEMLRLNLDLLREVAPRLRTDENLRLAFIQYERSTWNSVSGFPAGVFQCLLAEAAPESAAMLVAGVSPASLPEVSNYPNRSLVSLLESPTAFDELKKERGLALRLAGLHRAIAASPWLALGRLLGLTKALNRDEGKSLDEKHTRLLQRLLASRWLALGCRLRLRSAMAVIDLCRPRK